MIQLKPVLKRIRAQLGAVIGYGKKQPVCKALPVNGLAQGTEIRVMAKTVPELPDLRQNHNINSIPGFDKAGQQSFNSFATHFQQIAGIIPVPAKSPKPLHLNREIAGFRCNPSLEAWLLLFVQPHGLGFGTYGL